MCQVPQSSTPDLVAGLAGWLCGAKAACFFLSNIGLLQSQGKHGAPFAIKAEGRKLELHSRWQWEGKLEDSLGRV